MKEVALDMLDVFFYVFQAVLLGWTLANHSWQAILPVLVIILFLVLDFSKESAH